MVILILSDQPHDTFSCCFEFIDLAVNAFFWWVKIPGSNWTPSTFTKMSWLEKHLFSLSEISPQTLSTFPKVFRPECNITPFFPDWVKSPQTGTLSPRALLSVCLYNAFLAYHCTAQWSLVLILFIWGTLIVTLIALLLGFPQYRYYWHSWHWCNCSVVLSGCPNPHQPFSLVLTIRHTPTSHHPNIHQILTQQFITFFHEGAFSTCNYSITSDKDSVWFCDEIEKPASSN